MTDASARMCDVCGAVVPGSFRFCPRCSSVIRGEPTEAERQWEALQTAVAAQFELHERIGRGAWGTVYRAVDRALGREVAIKVLRADLADAEVVRARFLWNARLLARLEHPHVIPIYDVGESGALAWIVMPIMGESLAAVLLREGRPPPGEAIRILGEAADALEFVHEMGIVHRDIKPQHILLAKPDRHVRLIDFGLARFAATGAGSPARGVIGTPAYMSPELAEGRADVDGRSDIYSLGVVAYQLLTGELPFEGTAQQLMEAHRTRLTRNPSVRNQDIPLDLAEVVMRCLAKLPQNRWASARELLAALQRCGGPSRPAAVSPVVPSPPAAPARAAVGAAVSAPVPPARRTAPPAQPASAAPPRPAPRRPTRRGAPSIRINLMPGKRRAERDWVGGAGFWVWIAVSVALGVGQCMLR